MSFDIFHHYDCIVYDNTDGQNHSKQGNGIDGKTQRRQSDKGTDEGNRHGDGRDDGGAPALEKHVNDQHDQGHGLRQRFDHFLDRDLDKARSVIGRVVGHTGRKTLGQLIHLRACAAYGIERIRPRS